MNLHRGASLTRSCLGDRDRLIRQSISKADARLPQRIPGDTQDGRSSPLRGQPRAQLQSPTALSRQE
jgi:hypothetical protein